MFARSGWVLASVLLFATLPARVALLNQSLWLDEAWVANAALADSWSETLWGRTWIQSSPPLFMLVERTVSAISGPAEWSLRLVPLLASAASLFFLWPVLEEWFGRSVALLGASVFATNYWAIKMGQQTKQYTVELLISAVLLWTIARLMAAKHRSPWLLTALCCVAAWSSAAVWFWLPSAGLAVWVCTRSFARTGTFALLAGGSALANYVLFLRSALTSENSSNWASSMLSSWPVTEGARKLVDSLGTLLLPAPGRLRYAAWLLVGMALAGVAIELYRAARGAGRSRAILLTAALPILGGIIASMLGIYPVLDYPRVILWTLPGLTVLIAAGLRPVAGLLEEALPRFTPAAIGVGIALAIASTYAGWLLFPRPTENNRPAVASLARQAAAGDVIYVHGGVSEAFAYYARRWDRRPAVYLGNSGWPCCARNREGRVSDPSLRRFDAEMRALSAQAQGKRLWVYRPSGHDGHWSAAIRGDLSGIAELSAAGCAAAIEENYDQVEILAFDCL